MDLFALIIININVIFTKFLWSKVKTFEFDQIFLHFSEKNGSAWPLLVRIVSLPYCYGCHPTSISRAVSFILTFSPFQLSCYHIPKSGNRAHVLFCSFSECFHTLCNTNLGNQPLARQSALALAHILFDQRKRIRPHDC